MSDLCNPAHSQPTMLSGTTVASEGRRGWSLRRAWPQFKIKVLLTLTAVSKIIRLTWVQEHCLERAGTYCRQGRSIFWKPLHLLLHELTEFYSTGQCRPPSPSGNAVLTSWSSLKQSFPQPKQQFGCCGSGVLFLFQPNTQQGVNWAGASHGWALPFFVQITRGNQLNVPFRQRYSGEETKKYKALLTFLPSWKIDRQIGFWTMPV